MTYLWLNIESIFIALKQPPEVCAKAAIFCKMYATALPAIAGIELQRRFLTCQGKRI